MDFCFIVTSGDGSAQRWIVECIREEDGHQIPIPFEQQDDGTWIGCVTLDAETIYQVTATVHSGQSASVELRPHRPVRFPIGADWPLAVQAPDEEGAQADRTYHFNTGEEQ